ncbi:MAG: flagellar hook-basal body complex protein FliE [Parasphingorhabdus sp.]|uniref:flagellar hook-basal body complex protein FliE n=1 Tax=Parasphingorhabdus sp. TaxID=2709688 RepID=UPI0030015F74
MNIINSSQVMAMRENIIAQNEALKKAASIAVNNVAPPQPEFGAALASAFAQISETQHAAGDFARDYTMGKTNDIAGVMMAKQKASLGFELTLQVRNKLMNAYQDIMTMPV